MIYLKDARICLILDAFSVFFQILFFSIGIESTKEFGKTIGNDDLGNADTIIIGYLPFFIIQVILLVSSYIDYMKWTVQVLIIVVLIRSHIEFLYIEVLAPRDPS
jgi:hypothetical protein